MVTINEFDLLYMEQNHNDEDCENAQALHDYRMGIGLGFTFETKHLYGLSERESSLHL